MKFTLIFSAALIITTMAACTNNNIDEGALSVEPQTSSESKTSAPPSAPSLPSFNVKDAGGKPVNLQSYKGKKVFVNLWASWCPPCRREMPSIEKLYQSVDTTRVAFVMLSLDENFDKAAKFIKDRELDLPIYFPAENLPGLFNVQGIPTTFIFNEQGALIQRIDGSDDYSSERYRKIFE